MGQCQSLVKVAPDTIIITGKHYIQHDPSKGGDQFTENADTSSSQIRTPSIEHQLQVAITGYGELQKEVYKENPFLFTFAFINKLNAKRACIEALITRLELDGESRYVVYHSYFTRKEAALKLELYELFRNGRIRITADAARLPGVLDMLMPAEKGRRGGSELF
jgi:hypothetical protein